MSKSVQLSLNYSNEQVVSVAAQEMPIIDFIHYSFGEVLGSSYVIDQSLNTFDKPITLNVPNALTERQFFELVISLLDANGVSYLYDNDVFFLHLKQENKSKPVTLGLGVNADSVPNTSDEIVQVVPLKYGIKISVERTLMQLVDAKITADFEQSALFIRGKRENVLRALDIVRILDSPANRGKHIGLLNLTFITVEDFSAQVATLLGNEGLSVAVGEHNNKNLVLVPLAQIGAVAIFSSHAEGVDRVRYWAKLLDKPSMVETRQYFIYHPRFARASDIGDSLAPLIAARSGGVTSSRTSSARNTSNNTQSSETTGQAPAKASAQIGAQSDFLTFVIDERSNAIVFYTSGKEYQAIIPLIERLDVMPKQVMLDVVIAEVSLTDEFSLGVEFALKSGSISLPSGFPGASGGLITSGATGGAFTISGADGALIATALQTNQFVNVLSNPSLLVRDGVTADMSVGTQISVVGSTVTDDVGSGDKSKTNVEYRKTGVEISVTPTVNAQGIVIMEIQEKISNEVKGAAGAEGNPNIFERTLKTEVVAESGQTIILAGLVSSDVSTNDNGVPVLKDIPGIGGLFKSQSKSNSKTELVMLVTPRVIHRTDQWKLITSDFQRGIDNIKFAQP
ncbi:secretin N-terminal domain-containing protein [Agarivorans gilvus]|uniref:secretin N-terminal domain-containing protein n=1 Tax=Agarivorans gilvus TaxID=680279 RepID=UPI0018DE10D9|nr:secretin N-terminal domain-containing protein [Agarivorans gilvus]